jgi:hypothetical protein
LIKIQAASFICCIKQDSIAGSFVAGCLIGITLFIVLLMSLFLFPWFIVVRKKNCFVEIISDDF